MSTMADRRMMFVALNVSNLQDSVGFYRMVLGASLADTSHDEKLNDPWYGGAHNAISWSDGAFLHFAIYPTREPERPVTRSAQIGFHVADFDGTHQTLVDSGATVVQAPRPEPWGRTARYLDPDENIVSITEP
jgi:predicted enzyme related to lactoylglutathione lyase